MEYVALDKFLKKIKKEIDNMTEILKKRAYKITKNSTKWF